uniref:isochorismate synthase n=1 Tax=Chenopodium quinoa TaxID=63459 RepID=A0A803MZW3_CHEQI
MVAATSSFAVGKCITRFLDLEPQRHHYQSCSLSISMSMNGCQGDPKIPLGVVETRTLPSVPSPAQALDRLKYTISDLRSNQPYSNFPSGLIRIQVPIEQEIEAIDWLHSQDHRQQLPRLFFSGRRQFNGSDFIGGNYNGKINGHDLISVAGRSLLAANVAWDNGLSCPWESAIDSLQATLDQVNFVIFKSEKKFPKTTIRADILHIPDEENWVIAVTKALKMIRSSSALTKAVLARSSRIFTTSDIDPLAWLACLQAEGDNAYQFLLQPPNAPAFIGNTPEQLFHRKKLNIWSEALAGTRAICGSEILDHKTALDLLSSPKDNLEFTIVRQCIKKKLESVCNSVLVDPQKAIRKLPRVQHLYANLKGRLRSEDDEFEILSSLHPSPAVCGFPAEDARCLIAETGEEAEFAVGIRSALVKKGLGAFFYAGTGIVEGSDPSLEWEELELKTMQFTKLLRLEVPLLHTVT